MHHPYQRLTVCAPGPDPRIQFLLAASGHKLFSASLEDGSVVTQWPKEGPNEEPEEEEVEAPEGPPSKKRRVASTHEDLPNIIHIVVTRNQQHAVVVTAEDKSIRVFEISPDGTLEQLSQRCMPKRPCAVVISPDDNDIYSADKFGDVYALPLLMNTEDEEAFLAKSKKAAESKAYAPSATEQTVHSKANRRALDAQLKQAKGEKEATKPKDSLSFSHQLLLGHVSLLTDLLVTTIKPDESTEEPRTYLITSDRDEHIRISRGPPQSYVIEGFCLGHHEFINKICLVEPGLLVSGGGEDELFVWDWLQHKLVNKVNISKAVHKMRRNLAREKVIDADVEMGESDVRHVPDEQKIEEETEAIVEKIESQEQKKDEPSSGPVSEHKVPKVAVTNLWRFTSSSMGKSHLLFTCEGIPALFHFPIPSLHHEHGGEDIGYIALPGNALDIALLNHKNSLIVSVDTIHETGSTKIVDSSESFKPRLLSFELVGEDLDGGAVWKPQKQIDTTLIDLNEQSTVEWHEKALQTLLYSAENLRKRGLEDHEGAPEPSMAE